LVNPSAFPYLKLAKGKLAILSTPPDQCTRLEVQHKTPNDLYITNVFYLHMVNKFEAEVKKCLPSHSSCQPNIEDMTLKITAGQRKTVTLYQQDSSENYFR